MINRNNRAPKEYLCSKSKQSIKSRDLKNDSVADAISTALPCRVGVIYILTIISFAVCLIYKSKLYSLHPIIDRHIRDVPIRVTGHCIRIPSQARDSDF